jgi:hypothetical protein
MGGRPGELVEQFLAQPAIALDHVGVIELIGGERAGLRGDLGCPAHHRRDQGGRDALRARDQLDLGAERPHGADLLICEGIGRHDPQLHQAAASYVQLAGQLGAGPEETIRVLRQVIAT